MITAVHLGLLFIIDLAIVLLQPGNLRAACAFALLWVLPGYAWGRVMKGRWLAGFGLGCSHWGKRHSYKRSRWN